MIKVISVGLVDEEFKHYVEDVAREFYEKAGGEPELLEIYVYSTSVRKRAFMLMEMELLGIQVLGDFMVMHEAWRGWPRIHVDYEQCRDLDRKIIKALLLHELAHSKLHGSPYYYMLSLDNSLLDKYGFKAPLLLYLASITVKDLEVIELLLNLGYVEDVRVYAELLTRDIAGIECIDLEDVLELSKLIAPHIATGTSIDPRLLKPSCLSKLRALENILREVLNSNESLEGKIRILIGGIERMIELEL